VGLTFGSSPFGPTGPGRFDFEVPERVRYWEPWPRRMRAVVGNEVVLDSERARLFHETGRLPVHYFPLEDLRQDLLLEDPSSTHEPRTWSIRVGDRLIARAVHASPGEGGDELLPGFVAPEYAAMDGRFEEDDPIYGHPRDPYHRVDIRSSSRRVVVRLGDLLWLIHRGRSSFSRRATRSVTTSRSPMSVSSCWSRARPSLAARTRATDITGT
jgi:uncharacterized protein (DUF427 family)